MSTADVDFVAALSDFDQLFTDDMAVSVPAESIPDGDYEVEIESAGLKQAKTGTTILEASLKIMSGPQAGNCFTQPWFLKGPDNVKRMAADFVNMGFPVRDWNPSKGTSFSAEFPGAVHHLKGMRIRINKRTNNSGGKDYTNLTFKGALPGFGCADTPGYVAPDSPF